jgi:hypothetical protein
MAKKEEKLDKYNRTKGEIAEQEVKMKIRKKEI